MLISLRITQSYIKTVPSVEAEVPQSFYQKGFHMPAPTVTMDYICKLSLKDPCSDSHFKCQVFVSEVITTLDHVLDLK
jgi:hypothetical protein